MAEKGKRERVDMNNKIKEKILCLMLGSVSLRLSE